MESLESALSLLMSHVAPVVETETVSLIDALHRVAAEDVRSSIQLPPFDRSPLDGYALHSKDIASAGKESPVRLKVIGEACAGCGEVFHPARGEALRLMTGAPVPGECDCVIRQEDTDEGMDTVTIYAPVGHGKNICWAGEDLPAGSLQLRTGEEITPAHIGVLSGIGVSEVRVYRRPRVVLLCTGDELLQPGQPLTFGKIYDSSKGYLCARMAELGVRVEALGEIADDPAAVAEVLRKAAKDADLLITTGGVSVGKKDIMHQVLPLLQAERLFWRVAIKPGTPMMAGTFTPEVGADPKTLLCLSGNPFAAIACFEVIGRPVIDRISGRTDVLPRRIRARMGEAFPKGGSARRLIRARYDGEAVTFTAQNHSSGSLSSMIGCNCLVDIPAGNGPLAVGDPVEILLL